MEDYYETFKINLKYYREQQNLSQSQLAIQADCTNGAIGQIEAGISKPSFDMIIKLSADLFLRNASQTVNNTRKILQTELITNIQDFILRKF